MSKHKKKKKLKNSLKPEVASVVYAQAQKDKVKYKQAGDGKYQIDATQNTRSVRTSLWDFLNDPQYRKTNEGFVNKQTFVSSDVTLNQIPTAEMLLEQGRLNRRQKRFMFLSADAISHYYYAPKLLVRDELITDGKALGKVVGYTSFHQHREQVFLVPNQTDSTKADVLVLVQRVPSPGTKNQSSEAVLILYPDGNIDDAVSLFRFDHDKMLVHASKRFVDNRMYYLNRVHGAHFHTTTEEEQLYQDHCLSLDTNKISKHFDPSSVFGKWFAYKMEGTNGKMVESLEEFLEVCKNDFRFDDTLTIIDGNTPLKNIPVAQMVAQNTPLNNSFMLVTDHHTADFIQNAVYISPILAPLASGQKQKIVYDKHRLYHKDRIYQEITSRTEQEEPVKLNLEGATL